MNKDYPFLIRTDMADEAHRLWQGSTEKRTELSGVRSGRGMLHGLELFETEILDREGEEALGKARGKYYSLSLPRHFERGAEDFHNTVTALAEIIKECSPKSFDRVLVAALGNPDITPDALGSLAASSILVTRHLDRKEFPQFRSITLCRPGVLGTSGMESAAQVKSLCSLSEAELVIVIDALAGSEAKRLCRCIQISDAGISPGSGVGNDRQELSRTSLGVPVVAIGMPTVIEPAHLGGSDLGEMFMTPRSIDSLVRNAGRLIGYSINMAVHGLSVEDIDALVG